MYKNIEMQHMVESIGKYLDRKDMLGYAAARNTRILTSELMEYENLRDSLIEKYGEPVMDESGKPSNSISIKPDSPNFANFLDELGQFAGIEHDPKIFKINAEHVIGELSGSEIMEIDWMIED